MKVENVEKVLKKSLYAQLKGFPSRFYVGIPFLRQISEIPIIPIVITTDEQEAIQVCKFHLQQKLRIAESQVTVKSAVEIRNEHRQKIALKNLPQLIRRNKIGEHIFTVATTEENHRYANYYSVRVYIFSRQKLFKHIFPSSVLFLNTALVL